MKASQRKAHTALARATLSSTEMKSFDRLMNEAARHPSSIGRAPLELLVSFARLEAAGKIKSRFDELGQPVFEYTNPRRERKRRPSIRHRR